MGYELAIGDRSYSSWSLRGWLLFAKTGIDVKTCKGRMYSADFARLLEEFAPAGLVPALRLPEGIVIAETMAIAETLAERHPEINLWPADATDRALARWMSAEMHAGFTALRGHCAMNLRVAYADCAPDQAVLRDLERIEMLWSQALGKHSDRGPWLFGEWSIVDAFFAPVAARIAGHSLPVGDLAQRYVETQIADLAFRRWRAMGAAEGADQPAYARDWPQKAWPVPTPLPARALDDADPSAALNMTCPYSGDQVTHFLELNGQIWGFCNAFCRDKTIVDAAAWPAFTQMVARLG
ncbi:glutathione S-transferase [Albirhodobacter sp. R86504]|uniref:glutathione S-transferase n=1 Tax=Albirhodobacter sp. R86504 TaxID=3093848 RepID=UPI00366D8099